MARRIRSGRLSSNGDVAAKCPRGAPTTYLTISGLSQFSPFTPMNWPTWSEPIMIFVELRSHMSTHSCLGWPEGEGGSRGEQ